MPWIDDDGQGGWIVECSGEPATDDVYELSVVRRDNIHGRISTGWDGPDKIVICSDDINSIHNFHNQADFAIQMLVAAKAVRDALNSQYSKVKQPEPNAPVTSVTQQMAIMVDVRAGLDDSDRPCLSFSCVSLLGVVQLQIPWQNIPNLFRDTGCRCVEDLEGKPCMIEFPYDESSKVNPSARFVGMFAVR